MEIGKVQPLKVKKMTQHIIYLEDQQGREASLPHREGDKLKVGQTVDAFVYNGYQSNYEATLKIPKAQVGDLKKLRVVDKTKIGYFVNIGIDKDVLLPFSETIGRLTPGHDYLIYLYEDRTKRLAATMNIKDKLKPNDKFQVNDYVEGTIYGIDHSVGAFVAIEDEYDGMIPAEEIKGIFKVGDRVEARVQRILKTGFITLTLRQKAYKQMTKDAEDILNLLKDHGGELPIGDKSTPEEIFDWTGLSKKAFKRAEGSLYKDKLVDLYPTKIVLKD
ncbi:MAG: S1-like domain-containing RNA-binding protein [Tissierellia bacterium]|nr:S1-like domain-containing RNA-binding protein [Tissierellia bacterium]